MSEKTTELILPAIAINELDRKTFFALLHYIKMIMRVSEEDILTYSDHCEKKGIANLYSSNDVKEAQKILNDANQQVKKLEDRLGDISNLGEKFEIHPNEYIQITTGLIFIVSEFMKMYSHYLQLDLDLMQKEECISRIRKFYCKRFREVQILFFCNLLYGQMHNFLNPEIFNNKDFLPLQSSRILH